MDESGLKAHDPFRALKENEKNSIKPDTFGAGKKSDKAKQASNDLNAVEKVASEDLNGAGEGVAGAKEAEEKSDGLYSGGGVSEGKSKPNGFLGIARKGGPVSALLLMLFALGSFFLGGQALQPFGLVAEFQEVFNTMHVSANARSERFFTFQMKKRTVKSPYNIYGTKFSISEKQRQELKKQGIEYDEEYELDGKKTKAMRYLDADGNEKVVTADNFKKVYMEDPIFFNKYNSGSRTWRGQFANWFGTVTGKFLSSNKLTRHMWDKFKEATEKAGVSDDGTMVEADKKKAQKKIVQETINDNIKGEGDLGMRLVQEGEDDEGNIVAKPDEDNTTISRKVESEADVKAKLDDISGKLSKGSRANSVASAACGVLNLVGTISLLVTANEALQIIQITTSLFEAVDKTKAGLGDESPILVFSDALNERQKTTNVVLDGGEKGIESLKSVAIVRERSAMESAGVAGLFSRGLVNPNDPSVSSFNITSSLKRIAGGMGVSMAAFKSCTAAKMAGAIVSGVADAAEIGSCLIGLFAAIPTFGASAAAGCAPLLIDAGIQVAAGAALGFVLGQVTAAIVPAVSNALMRDLVSEFGGENFGNALTLGANLYQGGAHRANGGSLATMDKYKQFAVEQQRVIAENARYERETLSPFDVTSKYTFMGSIMNKMMSYSHANSVMSALTASGSVVSSSLANITGTASAYDISIDLPDSIDDYEKSCPYLASIGAIGDSFCNPYVVSDFSTIDEDPDSVLEEVRKNGGFSNDSGDNVEIDPESDLAKYIRYCDNRQSSFGIADQNIVNEVGNSIDTGSNMLNGAIGSVPVIGDVLEFKDDVVQFSNMGYISGESCVAGNTSGFGASPEWSKAKYYQRFIEDQSLAESMGLIEKSAVTAYLDDYYKENPVDNSYEGILARYSGLDKETVVAVLDIIEYEKYIADYDPSNRFVFGEKNEKTDEVLFDQENIMDGASVMLGQIVYADVRNRYYVV